MTAQSFEADCSACLGLCCVALSFERSAQFGHDKLAGQPCHHLDAGFRCSIHARREALGYDGCEAFDCLGAGQLATALHRHGPWRSDPAAARLMHADFSMLMRVQEMRQALQTAASLEMPAHLHQERQDLLAAFTDCADGGRTNIGPTAGPLLERAQLFLRRLRDVLPEPA